METFTEYIENIESPQQKARMEEILNWVREQYPKLMPIIAWNQPMFTDHGTFIIGFSKSKKHIAVAPEEQVMKRFEEDIKRAGYDQTKGLIRIGWDSAVDYKLLENIIEFNIQDKSDCETFWRK